MTTNALLRYLSLLLLPALIIVSGCRPADQEPSLELEVFNPHPETWRDAPVTLRLENYDLPLEPYVRVLRDSAGSQVEVPSQLDDLDLDGSPDELFFLLDLEANETTTVIVRPDSTPPEYAPRASAFLAIREGGSFEEGTYTGGGGEFVPQERLELTSEQIPDSNWVRFEGPVWESDLVGYRFYLNDRNLNDVFGKRVPDPVLLNAPGDQHNIQEWGTDVLLVGNTLSLGTPALATSDSFQRIDNAERKTVDILADGPLRAIVRTEYEGVVVEDDVLDVTSEQEIHAGSRWTEQRLWFSEELEDRQLVTGIVRSDAATRLETGSTNSVFYMHTFGPQSAHGDLLGLAVLIPQQFRPRLQDTGPENHRVNFVGSDGHAVYRYLAVWEREPTFDASDDYLKTIISRISAHWTQPLQVSAQQ